DCAKSGPFPKPGKNLTSGAQAGFDSLSQESGPATTDRRVNVSVLLDSASLVIARPKASFILVRSVGHGFKLCRSGPHPPLRDPPLPLGGRGLGGEGLSVT